MTDVWMVVSPNKTRVTFVIRGDEKSGFMYCIHSDGNRTVQDQDVVSTPDSP